MRAQKRADERVFKYTAPWWLGRKLHPSIAIVWGLELMWTVKTVDAPMSQPTLSSQSQLLSPQDRFARFAP